MPGMRNSPLLFIYFFLMVCHAVDFGDSGLRLYDLYLRASDRMPKRMSPAIEVVPVHVGRHEFDDDEDEEGMVVTRPKRILNNAMRDWVLYRHRLMPMEL